MGVIKVLITGAAGLVGSYLAEMCVEAGYETVGIDNFFRGSIKNLDGVIKKSNFKFIKASILDINGILNEPFDCVAHLAAVVATRHFYESALDTYSINLNGTKVMLDWAKKNKVKKFVNASSSEIYGHPQRIPTREDTPSFFDSTETTTRWSYALGKMLAEHIANCYKTDFSVSHLRFANIYGPRDIDESHVIPCMLINVHKGNKIIVNKNADKIRRSFLYATDAANAAFLAMSRFESGESFNVGSSSEITIAGLLKLIFELCRKNVEVEFSLTRAGDPERRLLDMAKSREKLGFLAEVSLIEGIKQTYEAVKIFHG